jgi:nucleotide-binding universal stress UspA family protein
MDAQKEYAKRLSDLCGIHDIPHEVKLIKAESIEQAIISEAKDYDLIMMGSTMEKDRKMFAFGRVQDRIAKAIDKPIMMVKKVIEK